MGKDSGGGSSGGGAPQVVQPEMPQSPLLSQGLLPGATGRMNASLPWLNSGGRTIDYLHQYSASPMQTPQFDMGGFQNLQNQQRQTAQAWQNGLGMMFPSPWGTQLGYAGGGMGTQRTPTGMGGFPNPGGPSAPPGMQGPTAAAPSGGGQQGGPNYDPNPSGPQYWGVGGNPSAEYYVNGQPHQMPGTQLGPIQATPYGGSDPLMQRQAQIEQQLRGSAGGQTMDSWTQQGINHTAVANAQPPAQGNGPNPKHMGGADGNIPSWASTPSGNPKGTGPSDQPRPGPDQVMHGPTNPQVPGSVHVGQNAPLARGSVNGGMPGAVPQQPFIYSPGSGQAGY